MANALEYFARPGLLTDPGDRAQDLDRLPGDIKALCRLVQGVMIHIFWLDRYGVVLPDERKEEVQLRSVRRKLARICELDPRPLTEVRPQESRLVGNCRDFSVLLTAILRHQGVPSRARCGFGRYFIPNHYEDHWVCEYWNATQKRWILVDAQLDELQCRVMQIPFDPLDVPRDQFIVGGKAWLMCRRGQADPDAFGIFDLHGLWFVRGDFIRDVVSLNKMELLPWDSWGIIDRRDEDLTAGDLEFLDRLAEQTQADVPEFDKLRSLYESDARLRVPATITSYTQKGPQTIEVAKEVEGYHVVT
jgi:hypothetical protein